MVQLREIGKEELSLIGELTAKLFPENYPLQFENQSVNTRFMHSAFLAFDGNGNDLGTAVVYLNPGHILQGRPAMALGYFQSTDDESVSHALFAHIDKIARSLGVRRIIGPLNGTTWESYRLRLTDDPPGFFLESHTPVFYNNLFRKAGFGNLESYRSFLLPSLQNYLQNKRVGAPPPGYVFRTINPLEYEKELRNIYALSRISFRDNFLYTDYSWEDFIEKYRKLEGIANPGMTLLAEYKGELAGFAFMVPDVLWEDGTRCILKTLAVHPRHLQRGLGTFLTRFSLAQMILKGFENCIVAYVIQGGTTDHMFCEGTQVYRNYTLYQKEIS